MNLLCAAKAEKRYIVAYPVTTPWTSLDCGYVSSYTRVNVVRQDLCNMYEEYYEKDPYYGADIKLKPPPVNRLWNVYGNTLPSRIPNPI
jgi:hypothetical protein